MNETITISKDEFERLLKVETFFNCLEACGVENWQGYDNAQDMLKEWEQDA